MCKKNQLYRCHNKISRDGFEKTNRTSESQKPNTIQHFLLAIRLFGVRPKDAIRTTCWLDVDVGRATTSRVFIKGLASVDPLRTL